MGIVSGLARLVLVALAAAMFIGFSLMPSGDRAWLAPESATIEGTKAVVTFNNIGAEPATAFVAQEEFGIVQTPEHSWYDVFPKENLTAICDRTKAVDGAGIVYPSKKDHIYRTPWPGIFAPEGSTLVMHGCFAYKTQGIERKAEYCFLLIREDGGEGDKIKSIRCPWGNDAT
jgi:hypothetical protein